MKKKTIVRCLLLVPLFLTAQEVIRLPVTLQDSIQWQVQERTYFSEIWQTQVTTNVNTPSLEVFRPSKEQANGAAVIVAPGGGFYVLSIESEGIGVAKRLVDKGYTAFVLKYRLVPTGADGVAEVMQEEVNFPERMLTKIKPVLNMAEEDGIAALDYVRKHRKTYGIEENKIGLMGFSAGGTLALNISKHSSAKHMPDFLALLYPWTTIIDIDPISNEIPPLFMVCASDDVYGLDAETIQLYRAWQEKGQSADLHIFSKGGHGFGSNIQDLPSDDWPRLFRSWQASIE